MDLRLLAEQIPIFYIIMLLEFTSLSYIGHKIFIKMRRTMKIYNHLFHSKFKFSLFLKGTEIDKKREMLVRIHSCIYSADEITSLAKDVKELLPHSKCYLYDRERLHLDKIALYSLTNERMIKLFIGHKKILHVIKALLPLI